MGLIIRYQSRPGRLNREIRPPSGDAEPTGGFLNELAGGDSLERSFRLQDYLEDELPNWPIIRSIWRGDVFFRNLEKNYPTLATHADFETWKSRWRYYATQDNHLNILPSYKTGARWFALFYVRGLVWVELKEPAVPGLLKHWIQLVRNDHYRRVPFAANVAGSYLSSQVSAESQPSVEPFSVAQFSPQEISRGALTLFVEPGSGGGEFKGRFDFCLGPAPDIAARSVKIGEVFKGMVHLDLTSEKFAASRRRPQISRKRSCRQCPPDLESGRNGPGFGTTSLPPLSFAA